MPADTQQTNARLVKLKTLNTFRSKLRNYYFHYYKPYFHWYSDHRNSKVV
jgi:hypothetical protein